MAIVTTTGTGTPTTLAVSTASGVLLPANASTSLFQTANITVTGTGHTVAFIGRTQADLPLYVQVDISIDGTSIYNDHAGQQIVVKQALTVGSHTITFTAYAFNQACNMLAAGLMAIDLGL